jgi:outer membrane immunogenic protein
MEPHAAKQGDGAIQMIQPRHFLLGGAAVLALTAVAQAADVPMRAPVAPIYTKAPALSFWEGVYVGVHGGYAWADNDTVLGGAATNFRPDGGFGGIQFGYNRHLSPRWVLGFEVDLSYGDLAGRRLAAANPAFFDVNAFGTARTRLGYAQGPWLFYATAGAAWADTNIMVPAAGLRYDRPQVGYVIGAGVEYALNQRWSAKLEYLYADLDTTATNNGGATTDLTMSTVRFGLNYRFADMPVRALGYDAQVGAGPFKAPVRTANDWSGPYIGVHGGFGTGSFDATATALDPSGGFAGIQSGYNWQVSRNWVVGLESDSSWGSINDAAGANNVDIDAMGTVRARIGYAMNRWLVYGTGGLAWAHADATYAGFVNDRFYLGWAAGAGIEYMIAPRWTAKLEYIYADYGSITDNADTANLTASTIKFGVNYRASILDLIGMRW